ncbi:amino acid permease [Mycolicibacterium sp. CH28]|uniref:APC family permease n=1 Tax=Mycolicibacterium sp. CH28 TaxID=2512237 RepID=UPI001080F495|nr:APC family permease [Mycolicibacterium sp. CH28]TGD89655.1 amino acid permease [Mycolicibacterium sp. CH28]
MAQHDHEADLADLASHGYTQRLSRSLGGFSSFAAGFSYISILTGMFQLFGFGYGFGGPLLFWSWVIVLAGQFCVALVFAELSARYPIAGSVYQWSKKMSSRAGSWMAGWTMLVGSLVSVAAVSVAEQIVLPQIWSGFQVIDNDGQNAILLGSCTVALTTTISLLGVRLMALINNIGVAAEIIGVALIVILLLFHIQRGPGVVLTTQGAGPGLPGWGALGLLAPLLMAAIMPAYVMYGFDTAGSLSEETKDPRRTTPKALLRALAAAGLCGAALLLLALMTAHSLDLSTLGTGGLPMVLQDALGSTVGKLLLVDVAFAIFICTLAIQTASIRLAFSMARDHALPFGAKLAHVGERRQSPILPAIVSGLVAIGLLVLNAGNSKVFLVITSVAIVVVYLAYLLVTIPVLVRRLRGWPEDRGEKGWFYLGRGGGIIINAVAVGYGLLMSINLIWPRTEIYGDGVYAWGGVIFILAIVVGGAGYYLARQHGKDHGIAEEHRHIPVAAGEPLHADPV